MMGISLPLAELKEYSELEQKYQAFEAILTFTLKQIKSVYNYKLALFKTFDIIRFHEIKSFQQGHTDISFVRFMPRFSDQSGQTPEGAVIKGIEETNVNYDLREVKILERFCHPNLCQLYEYIRYQNYLIYFLKEYEGTLSDFLKYPGLNIPQKVKIMKSISQALLQLHSFNIIHRDLKPDNIMFATSSNKQIEDADFIIIDFDRSYSTLNSTTLASKEKSTFYEGTDWYAPPEAGRVNVYFESYDVFQLGMIFLEIILDATNKAYGNCQCKNDPQKFNQHMGRDQTQKKLREFENKNNVRIPQKLEETILKMISYRATDRPTLAYVLEQLINLCH